MSTFLKTSILCSLCMSNALYTVIRRESVRTEKIPTEEVVIGSEIVKLLFCLYFILYGNEETSSGGKGWSKVAWLVTHSSKMIVVAVCYLIMNVLSFICLNYIGAGEFTVYSQLKILTTASFSTLLLGTVFSAARWRALMLLVIGCILVASPVFNTCDSSTDGVTSESSKSFYEVGLGYGMTIVQVVLSGFVTIYFEKVIKSTTEVITVWERNFQLCFYSILCCLFMMMVTGINQPTVDGASQSAGMYIPMSNWSFLTVVVMLLGAANGLLVAATLKYADSIMKVMAQAGAIIVATTLGYLFQGDPMDIFVVLGSLASILAITNYTFDETPSRSIPPASSTSSDVYSTESSSSKRKISDYDATSRVPYSDKC